MDARPNVVVKILPCYKRLNMQLQSSNGVAQTVSGWSGYRLDKNVDKYIRMNCVIPPNMKAGTDVSVIINACPSVANTYGADQVVRLTPTYNYARAGVVVGSGFTVDPLLITIPDGELVYFVHEDTVLTIPNLQAGDGLDIMVLRNGVHGDDDYNGGWLVHYIGMLRYIIDKIGVLV